VTASRFGVALAGIALALSALAAPAAAQWTRVEDLPPFDVFSLHANGDTLLAGGYDVVWRSVDDGASWQPSAVVNATLPSVEAIWLTPGRLWIGSYGQGVYVSPDFGATWQAASQGLAGGLFNTHLYVTDFERRGDSLFVSTDGAGTFVRALGGAAWQKFGTAFEANVAGSVTDLAVEGGRLIACAGGNGLVFHRDPGAPDWTFSTLGNGEPVPGLQASGALWSGTRWLVATQAGTYGSATGTGGWSPLGPSLGARLDGRVARGEALVMGAF
jgi:hypothetical protein